MSDHQINMFDINCFLNLSSELKKWIEIQSEVAAEPVIAAKENARAAKEKVLSLLAIFVSRIVIFILLCFIGKGVKEKTKGEHGQSSTYAT
jgi:hypothetical protein